FLYAAFHSVPCLLKDLPMFIPPADCSQHCSRYHQCITPKGVGPARVPAAKRTSPPDPMASKMASVRSWPVELMAFTVCITVSVPERTISAIAMPLPNLLRANPLLLAAWFHCFNEFIQLVIPLP